jgi:hypothetical protein
MSRIFETNSQVGHFEVFNTKATLPDYLSRSFAYPGSDPPSTSGQTIKRLSRNRHSVVAEHLRCRALLLIRRMTVDQLYLNDQDGQLAELTAAKPYYTGCTVSLLTHQSS